MLSHALQQLIFLVIIVIALSSGGCEGARRLGINRNSANLQEESGSGDGEVAVVKEVKPRPYPAAGYRPGRAFNLPGEQGDSGEEGSGFDAITTTTEYSIDTSTTITNGLDDIDTTTQLDNLLPAALDSDNAAKQGRALKAPYPAAGYRPSRAFLLPTEVKAAEEAAAAKANATDDSEIANAMSITTTTTTSSLDIPSTTEQQLADIATLAPATSASPKAPYPPAGYRPSRAFLLPTELAASFQHSTVSVNEPEPEPPVSPADKAGHPACGVSDNPVAPIPAEDAKDNPDAERVYVTASVVPPVRVVAAASIPHAAPLVLRAQPLLAAPAVYVAPVARQRPFAYSAIVQSW